MVKKHSCLSELLWAVVTLVPAVSGAQAGDMPDTSRVAVNFRLNCGGCHLEDGTGRPGRVPPLADNIGKIIAVPGGREYIGRIPGIANSFMTDAELSELLNWAIYRFDAQHAPPGLEPYTPDEVARLRRHPMSDATVQRAALMKAAATTTTELANQSPAPVKAVPPPMAFALCSACHPTSTNGANGIGPNLRGIVGRKSGQAPNYMYSAAMNNAQITWDTQMLERYLTSPANTIPGNAMTYRGEPNPSARAAIIEYLQSLH